MKKTTLLLSLLITISSVSQIFAQALILNPAVVTNKLTVGAPSTITSAVFEANSTTQGFLIPRMTTAQRGAIAIPFPTLVVGLMVYDTDLKDLYIYNGGWKRATIGEVPIDLSGSANNLGILRGTNSATFGIGLDGTANTGTGVSGFTQSGTGVKGIAGSTGAAGVFFAQSGSGIFVENTTNTTTVNSNATARILNNTIGGKALDVTGTIVQTTDKNGDGITATNTNANGVAIKAIGTFMGVRAQSTNGTAVLGDSFAGRGIEGNSSSGNGVGGFSVTGQAGYFQNNTASQSTVELKNLNVGGKALEVTGTMNLTSNLNLAPAASFNNTNTNGIGLKSEGNFTGVYGVSTNGSGVGVNGYSTSGVGIAGASLSNFGVRGDSETGSGGFFVNNTNTNPTVKIENMTSGGTALEMDGAIKVSGTNRAAFVITATAGNTTNGTGTSGGSMTIPNTTLANNATDILIVTHAFGTYLNSPFGVFWTGTNWTIYLEQFNTNMPTGTKFNVLVIKQ